MLRSTSKILSSTIFLGSDMSVLARLDEPDCHRDHTVPWEPSVSSNWALVSGESINALLLLFVGVCGRSCPKIPSINVATSGSRSSSVTFTSVDFGKAVLFIWSPRLPDANC